MMDLISLLNKLETSKISKVLFSSSKISNYCESNINYNLFVIVCNNFFQDIQDEDNMKIRTIKYWFLHNLTILFQRNKELIYELDLDGKEMKIISDYYKVTQFNKERKTNEFIFLPKMNLFSSWCNVSNNEKMQIHHKIIEELINLDDNYFFMINYLRMHTCRFLTNTYRSKSEMDNGNNILIYFIRSAVYKNNICAFKNFAKIFRYLFDEVLGEKFMEIMMRKNNLGKRAINMLVYLREEFYDLIIEKIILSMTSKEFMEKYFSSIIKNINHAYQLEIIFKYIPDEIINYGEKFENLYYKVLKNRSIMFYEKYMIVLMLLERKMIEILEEDKEKLGRKMWEKLHSREQI